MHNAVGGVDNMSLRHRLPSLIAGVKQLRMGEYEWVLLVLLASIALVGKVNS